MTRALRSVRKLLQKRETAEPTRNGSRARCGNPETARIKSEIARRL